MEDRQDLGRIGGEKDSRWDTRDAGERLPRGFGIEEGAIASLERVEIEVHICHLGILKLKEGTRTQQGSRGKYEYPERDWCGREGEEYSLGRHVAVPELMGCG